MYDGDAPAAGIVTGIGRVSGREVMIVANDARGWCVAVVHLAGGERGKLEEGRTGIEQTLDPFADRQLALRAMPLDVLRAAAVARARQAIAQLAHELAHLRSVGGEDRIGRIDVRVERYHPQQSLLNPQAAQRQTACMR